MLESYPEYPILTWIFCFFGQRLRYRCFVHIFTNRTVIFTKRTVISSNRTIIFTNLTVILTNRTFYFTISVNYSPFHKTLPKSSLKIHWISVRFFEMDDRFFWFFLPPLPLLVVRPLKKTNLCVSSLILFLFFTDCLDKNVEKHKHQRIWDSS